MIIKKQIKEYIIPVSASLQEALTKINDNKHQIVYAVDEKNCLVGSLTDGDIRRWILSSPNLELSVGIESIVRQPCFSLNINEDSYKISNSFNERIASIPLIDDVGHLVAIAEEKANVFQLGDIRVSKEDPAFIIAEVGNNHQGDISLAKKLVDFAVESNVDCVKFQMRKMDALYINDGDSDDASADLGAQYTLDLLSKFQLDDEDLFEVFEYCKAKNVLPLCTPWDLQSLKKLEEYGMPAYKVASADFTNFQLLDALAKTGKLLICSTGMSNESEINETVTFLKRKNAQFVLLHCNSTYPTPYKDVNLRYLTRLEKISGGIVGYSGHERGWSVPVAAIALGAKVIEKHITTDKTLEGNDHKVSLLPTEFKSMVEQIRQVEASLGESKPREISQGELMNREILAKSIVAKKDLKVGDPVTLDCIEIKSPGQGLQPNRIDELLGKNIARAMSKGDFFFESDLRGGFKKKERYSFNRPCGIPVRFHDYKSLTEGVELDFVEFHLSYKDLEVKITDFIPTKQLVGFAVHAPELFEGDHILDLASSDQNYRNRSIVELNRVITKTNELKNLFASPEKPVIVVNAGGWDTDDFVSEEQRNKKYNLLKESFSKIDVSEVTIAIQTMPPFPWHFGGQSYHNLFVDPHEIADFCNETGLKVCFDVSHSMMACNFYGWDIYDFAKIVAPYNVHMHIVDAKGIDGEGIQIGEGDVNFEKLAKVLDEKSPGVQFIPEIWQGHKNSGEGFWHALSFLEKYL